jgi:hypothetical protein
VLRLEGKGGAKTGGVLDVVRARVRGGVEDLEAARVGQELCSGCWASVEWSLD